MGFDDSLGDGQSQPGPFGLGREKRIEDFRSLLGGDARAVIVNSDAHGGLAVELHAAALDVDRDGRRAGGQCVVEQIAKNLIEPKRIADTAQVDAIHAIREGVPSCRLRACSRWAHDSRQTCARSQGDLLKLDRGRVAANVFVEMMKVVLCLLKPVDQARVPRAGRGLATRAFRGKPGSAEARCGSRVPAR